MTSMTMILLKHLKEGNIVTTETAPTTLGIPDVRSNIRSLRNMGYEVKDRWVEKINVNGRRSRHKEYFMDKPEQEDVKRDYWFEKSKAYYNGLELIDEILNEFAKEPQPRQVIDLIQRISIVLDIAMKP